MSESILHIATEAEWIEAQRIGEIHPDSLEAVGFVHCSTPEQLPRTLARHFAAVENPVVLVIDPSRTGIELRWEAADGEEFPHLYGAIPLDAVTGVRPAH